MTVKRVLIAGLLFLLAGCVTDGSSVPNRWSKLPEAERATVIGTITADVSGTFVMSRYKLSYRNVETKEEAYLDITTGLNVGFGKRIVNSDPELEVSGKSIGHFFEVSLPPGQYEIYEVYSTATTLDHYSRPFRIPFKVDAGGVYYLGELRAYPIIEKDFIGIPNLKGGYFVLRDNRERDVALWSKRHAGAETATVRNLGINVGTVTSLLKTKPIAPFDTAEQK